MKPVNLFFLPRLYITQNFSLLNRIFSWDKENTDVHLLRVTLSKFQGAGFFKQVQISVNNIYSLLHVDVPLFLSIG